MEELFRIPNTKVYNNGAWVEENQLLDAKKNHSVNKQVDYLGKLVSRDHFRVFIYKGNDKKLVNSYDEYVGNISTGEWFSTIHEAESKIQANVVSMEKEEDLIEEKIDPRAVVNANKFGKTKHDRNS
jgi:hypothetical protein